MHYLRLLRSFIQVSIQEEMAYRTNFFISLLHSLQGNASHFGDDVHHVLTGHEHFLFFPFFTPSGKNGVELLLGLLFLIPQGSCLLEILACTS